MGVNAAVVDAEAQAATGDQDITIASLGWTPTAYICWASSAVTDGVDAAHFVTSFGMSDDTREVCLSSSVEDGAGSANSFREMDSDQIIRLHDGTTGGTDGLATHVAMISDGVRINWSNTYTTRVRMHFLFLGGTDLEVHVGSDTHPGGDDVANDTTDPGFQPDVVIYGSTSGSLDSGSGSNAYNHISGADDTRQAFVLAYDRDGQNTIKSALVNYDNRVIQSMHSDTLVNRFVEHTSMLATGFRTTMRNVRGSAALDFIYIALKSTTNGMFVGMIQGPAAGTGDKAVTGIGFKPQVVCLAAQGNVTLNSISSGGNETSAMSIGLFDGTRETSVGGYNDDGVWTSVAMSRWNSTALFLDDGSGTTNYDAAFTSFDTDGYTLDYTTNGLSQPHMLVFAIEEDSAAPATVLQDIIMGPGIIPFER